MWHHFKFIELFIFKEAQKSLSPTAYFLMVSKPPLFNILPLTMMDLGVTISNVILACI